MEETIKRPVGRPPKNKIVSSATEATPQVNFDGWDNVVTGLGQKQDKSAYTQYGSAKILDDGTLTEMFLGDGLSNRIISVVAADMTREWIYFPNEAHRNILVPVLELLDGEEKFNEALIWQRLYGGSILLMGILDGGSLDSPLREDKIKGIEYLRAIDRTCINISESIYDLNPNSPMFGKIIKFKVRFRIQNQNYDTFVHYTRLLEFHNDPVPVGTYSEVDAGIKYFGMSSLQTISESLSNLGGIIQSTANIMLNFCSTTLKFKGLAQLLAADASGTAQAGLVRRLNAIMMSQSVLNSTILDSEEFLEKQYTTLAGLPEVMDRFMLHLSGVTGIPVTRLFGRSPSGLNATGAEDTRSYYDLTEAAQRNRLLPPLRRLINLIARWKGIEEDVAVEFNSLYQLTEEEKSKIAFLDAQSMKFIAEAEVLYIEKGVRDGEEVSREHGWAKEYQEPIEPEEETPAPEVDSDDAATE